MEKKTLLLLSLIICAFTLAATPAIAQNGFSPNAKFSAVVPAVDDKHIPKPAPTPPPPPLDQGTKPPPPVWRPDYYCNPGQNCYDWYVRDGVETGKKFDPPPEPPAPKMAAERNYFTPGGSFERVKYPPNYDNLKRATQKSDDEIEWYNMMTDAWR